MRTILKREARATDLSQQTNEECDRQTSQEEHNAGAVTPNQQTPSDNEE